MMVILFGCGTIKEKKAFEDGVYWSGIAMNLDQTERIQLLTKASQLKHENDEWQKDFEMWKFEYSK